MKRLKLIICVLAGLMVLTACAQKKNTEMNKETISKVLVTYFSATGTTKNVAEKIADITGGDLYEIVPEMPYTSADLNWNDNTARSSVEMQDLSFRPAIKGKCDNINGYDVIFIGFPIWWYTNPTIINTFIEAHNLQDKTLVPFATSGGSTIARSCQDLKNLYPDYKWIDGRLLNNPTESELMSWTKSIIK